MPYLAPETARSSHVVATCAYPAAMVRATSYVYRCPHLCRTLCRKHLWILLLSAVAPYGGFLLPHERYV